MQMALLKIRHFFYGSIFYPFVNFWIDKRSFEISSKVFLDILNYVEQFGLTPLQSIFHIFF